MKNILIVEDEKSISTLLIKELTFEGYHVFKAMDGLEAVQIFEAHSDELDVVLLDWMLPKLDGLGVLRRIKRIASEVPVIFLTARGYVGDKIAGLDAGADDYMTKPFDVEELLARLRVIFRKKGANSRYIYGPIILDSKAHLVTNNGKNVELTQREYALLQFFFEHQSESVSRADILDEVWGMNFPGQMNTVDTYVRYLRKKFGVNLIETIHGFGYRLNKYDEKKENTDQ